MTASNAADVLNLVGFVTGTALYAMLLALVVRGAARPPEAPARRDWLPLATALLGLSWNLGELAAYALPRLGLAADSVGLSALSFPALGLLAAVVVHSVVRDLRYSRAVIALAYALAVSAGLLHIRTVISGDPATSTLAFQLLTISFSMLIVPLAFITRAQPNGRRALWVLALVLFAVSATHLGSFHSSTDSWWMQLLGHHAAIPLAFAILYQNYRFALGDLFLKQALTLLAIVTVTLAGYSAASAVPEGPASVGLLLALWVATALVAPWLRRAVVRFVDAILLGRADYGALRAGIGCAIDDQPALAGVMDTICKRLAGTFSARQVWWTTDESTVPGGPESLMQAVPPMRAGAPPPSRTVTVATTDRPHLFIHVGELTGGRRLLSDDEALLETVAMMAARRIDAIRLTLERYETQLREEEMQKLAAEAELKALRAQINPHFLFNALTTIGYLIDSAPSRALDTLLRLTRLLRGVLRPEGEFTTLGRELDLVEHYLDIERERFEERLRVRVDVPPFLRGVAIPSLVVQPLVENAIKHGVAPSASGGDVEVLAERVDATEGSPRLRVIVRNTGAALSAGHHHGGDHVGLENVARRLRGHYGSMAGVTLSTDDRGSTVATLELPFTDAAHPEEFDAQAVAGRPGRR